MIVNATQLNLASVKMECVDFDIGYGFDTEASGFLWFFARGTWLRSYEIEAAPGSGYVDRLGKYSPVDGASPVPLRSTQGVRWHYGNLNASLTMNYVDDYECSAGCYVPDATGMPVRAPSPVRISDWKTFDFNIGYDRSEEHTSELQSLMRISYAVFCLKKKNYHARRAIDKICIHINNFNDNIRKVVKLGLVENIYILTYKYTDLLQQ